MLRSVEIGRGGSGNVLLSPEADAAVVLEEKTSEELDIRRQREKRWRTSDAASYSIPSPRAHPDSSIVVA
jgi:hypothetical protein